MSGLAALPPGFQAGIGVGIFIVAALCIIVSIILARMMGYDFGFGSRKKTAYEEWNEWYDQREKEMSENPDSAQMSKEERLEKVRSQYIAQGKDPHVPAPLRKTFVNPELQMVDMPGGAAKNQSRRIDVAGFLSSTLRPMSGNQQVPDKKAAAGAGAQVFDSRGSNAGLDEVDINDLYGQDRSLSQIINDLKEQQSRQAAVLAALEGRMSASVQDGSEGNGGGVGGGGGGGVVLNPMRPNSGQGAGGGRIKSKSMFGEFNPLVTGGGGSAPRNIRDGTLHGGARGVVGRGAAFPDNYILTHYSVSLSLSPLPPTEIPSREAGAAPGAHLGVAGQLKVSNPLASGARVMSARIARPISGIAEGEEDDSAYLDAVEEGEEKD